MTHPDLAADCSKCFGLCCTALGFSRADGFGHDKPAGVPCHFLDPSYGCTIHPRREALGYEGCIDFDCLGAGQRASAMFAATNWQNDPATKREMFAAFAQLLKLQEARAAIIEASQMQVGERESAQRVVDAIAHVADAKQWDQTKADNALDTAKTSLDDIITQMQNRS